MENRGKPWSFEDDQRIMQNPHLSNTDFSRNMGRTENAIKYRRSHLAFKLHQKCPHTTLEECVAILGGELAQAETLKDQDRIRQISMDEIVNSSRKRKSSEEEIQLGRPVLPDVHPMNFHLKPEHEKISIICKALREEDGKLWHLWNDPDFLPYLVMYNQGLTAYAMSLA
jgi:hypothetical protein